ncbi:hypothetical protein XpopCFBP1817_10925 [Xanthomonas populi]|uniref:Uncharacterized protein n=1 Tax=Xanthomonas populi TaxID=53414 RepID=A0A2S7ENQ2_9XANT|nr:hypothetical protein XpopCFBP1817_10925 [Xanthomonas populi]
METAQFGSLGRKGRHHHLANALDLDQHLQLGACRHLLGDACIEPCGLSVDHAGSRRLIWQIGKRQVGGRVYGA